MKKVLAVIVVTIMLFSITANAQTFSSDVLSAVGLIPVELVNHSDDTVNRAAFAAVAAAMAGMEKTEPVNTAFSDVTEENAYSGAIQAMYDAGFMTGTGNNLFEPESPITGQQAIAAFIRITNYTIAADYYGGWPAGYIRVAQNLGLLEAFSSPVTQPLKYSDLWKLCDLVMDVPMGSSNFISGDVIHEEFYIPEDTPLYMNEGLGIYRYEGFVESVDIAKHFCVVKVTNYEGSVPRGIGEKLALTVAQTVNIAAYDKMKVEILVDDNDRLLHIVPAKNTMSKYAVISSINGDNRTNVKYLPSAVYSVMLLDDRHEYSISEKGLKVYYNGKEFHGSLSLTGKYARVVTEDNKVCSLTVWDMAEGGLITDVNYDRIIYFKGESTQRLADLDSFESRMLIVNGEIRELSELKTGTVFDYYADKDSGELVIFASEKKISDVYECIGEEEIEIGNISLLRVNEVYASTDGTEYNTDTLKELIGKNVTAYVDILERVRYVCSADKTVSDNDFIGYFLGYEQEKLNSKPKLFKIINLEDEEFSEEIYTVSKRFKYEGNIDEAYESAGLEDGTPIYEFELNDKGEISSMKKAEAFYGFADADGEAKVQYIGSFPQSAFPYMWVGGKKLYFDNDVNIVGMYKKDGELSFGRCSWNTLSGKICDDSVIARFFGEYKSSDVDMIFMTGNLESICQQESSFGVVTRVIAQKMDNGEFGKKIVVNNGNSYVLTDEAAWGIEENTIISYGNGAAFGSNEVCILSSLQLDGKLYDWVGLKNQDIEMKIGTVEKIDEKRVYFTDGTAHFINRSEPLFFSVSDDGILTGGSYMDNLEGKDIVYAADNSLVYVIFYQE